MVTSILEGRSNAERKFRWPAREVCDLYQHGFTIKEVAGLYGVSVEPIKRTLREAGVARRPARPRAGTGAGAANPAWRGGRRIRPDGYVEIWTASGPRLEHQVAMERHLGRALLPGEVVHHRDRNKQNNAISNLELTTQSAHAREHAAEMHRARYAQ